ncbi:hypothetical protein [Actinoplanes sp. NPDC026619]
MHARESTGCGQVVDSAIYEARATMRCTAICSASPSRNGKPSAHKG